MQGRDVRVQLGAVPEQRLLLDGGVHRRDRPGRRQRAAQRLGQGPARPDPPVKIKHQIPQPCLVQPLQHRVDGGALLGDEQHLASQDHQRRDEVRDGLALAGAGRPAHDEALPGQDRVHRELLAGVSVQHHELVCGEHVVGLGDRTVGGRGGANRLTGLLVAGHGGHQVMRHERVQVALEVPDHRQLRVGEVRQDEPGFHGEPGHGRGLLLHPRVGPFELPGLVDHTLHPVEQRIGVDRQPALGPQEVQERGVDLHLLDEGDLEVVLGGAERLQLGPAQQHGRGRVPFGLGLPRGQAASQVQRLHAALLEVLLGLPVDGPETPGGVHPGLLRGEQGRHAHGPPGQQGRHRSRGGGREVEGPELQLPVPQQIVPPGEVEQRGHPRLRRPPDGLDAL